MKYEVRNKTLSLKGLNYRRVTDRVSVFKTTSKLHAIANSGKKYIYLTFSSQPLSSLEILYGVHHCDLRPIGSEVSVI